VGSACDHSIYELDNARGASGDRGVVRGDEQCSLAFLAQRTEQVDDSLAGV
jgi:hypothetical protein